MFQQFIFIFKYKFIFYKNVYLKKYKLDSDLSFRSHIEHVKTTTYRIINLVFKFIRIRDIEIYCMLYRIYVLPSILYGLPVYCKYSKSFIDEMEKIQKYFTRRLFLRFRPNEIRPRYAE